MAAVNGEREKKDRRSVSWRATQTDQMRATKVMSAYFSSEWIHEEKRRYYRAWVQQDLFGDWVLCCRWGSLDSARGGHKTFLCSTQEEGAAHLQKFSKRRISRGYSQN